MANDGFPSQRPKTSGDILRALTGAATLAIGSLLVGQGTSQLAALPNGGAGQLLVAGASTPAWSGSSLTWASNQLAGSGGSTPVAQAANAWALANGTARLGTSLIVDGVGAGSITTAGGVLAAGSVVSDRSSGSQVTLLGMTKRSAGGSQQYAANFASNGPGTFLYLQLLDAANAFYTNAFAYDYANKRFALADIITPECSFHVGGGILASGTGAAGRFIKSVYNVVAGGATSSDGIQIQGRAGGTSGWVGTITTAALSASQTYTMPDATGTVALLSLAQTWSANQQHYGESSAFAGVLSGTYQFGAASTIGAALSYRTTGLSANSFLGIDMRRWTGTATNHNVAGVGMESSGGAWVGALYYNAAASNTWATTPILTWNASGVSIGAAALLGAERLRVAGGTMGTPGTTDVLVAAGRVYAGDTGLTSLRAAGGAQIGTQFGVGTAASASIGINVTQTALTGTTQYGHLLSLTGTSAATSAIQGLTVALGTAAASFTCGQVQGFRYLNLSLGAGSAVTTQYAIRIDSLSGAATNYAFSSAGAGLFSIGDTTDASAIGTAGFVMSGGGSFAKSLWVGGTAGNYINIANASGELRVNGTKVLGAQGAAVADATGGSTVDAEARTAINTLLARMRAHGSIAT